MREPSAIHRRHFVQQAASGLAAAVAVPTIIAAQPRNASAKPAASDKVSVGLIGAGDFGRRQHLGRLLLPNPARQRGRRLRCRPVPS